MSKEEKTVTVVINNTLGVQIIQLPHRKVQMADPRFPQRLITGDTVDLLPGANFIDTEVLGVMMENPLFVAMFATKIPPGLAPEHTHDRVGHPMLVRGKVLPAVRPMAKLTDAEVIALVPEMTEPQLERFAVEEKPRQEVREAIETRLEQLQNPGEVASAGG